MPAPEYSLPPDGRQSEQALAIRRGATRLLAALDFACLPEAELPSGRRADLVAVGARGLIWIVEIKSSLADFRADGKWESYRAYADRVLFAVAPDFPNALIPDGAGLIVADGHGGDLLREGLSLPLNPATRKVMLAALARKAAGRLMRLADPEALGVREF